MKSQDIFLLIKLVSLADAARRAKSPLLDESLWRDWEIDETPPNFDADGLPPLMPARARTGRVNAGTVKTNAIGKADIQNILDGSISPDVSGLSTSMPTLQRPSLSDIFSVRSLSDATGIGKSEISNIMHRCYESGLARPPRDDSGPSVNRTALVDVLIHGIRYVFPVKPQNITRGIATGVNAPVFVGALRTAGELGPVWPDPKGTTMGVSIEPLYKTVPTAVREDSQLYATLALVDSLRIGQARERQQAAKILIDILGH